MERISRAINSKTTRRGFLQLGGAAGLAVAATACGAGGAGSSSGGTGALTILCEAGGQGELTKIAEAFRQQKGREVTFVELPYEGLFNRLNGELPSGSVSFDIAVLDAVWLPTFGNVLQSLDDLFTPDVRADLFEPLVASAQIGGKYVGMPAWTNAEILFYRKDLFEDGREQAAFQQRFGYPLAPPTNWQQFQDIATFFTRGTELYGTDVKGAVETEWLAHVLQAGAAGVVLDDQGNVIIDDDKHLSALQFHSDLNNRLKVSPPGVAQLDWAGAQNLFHQGKTAMLRFFAHEYPQIPKDSPIHGKVGAAPMIAGSAGIGAIPAPWYLSVPTAGKQQDLAKEFIRFAYDNNALAIESKLGLAARKSAFDSYAGRPGYEHFAPLMATLNGPATKSRPANAKWQQIVDTVLVPTLQKSLTDEANYAALLAAARKDVESIVK